MSNPDDLYTTVWPEYAATQRKDLFWYERLWAVLLRQLEKRHPQRTLIEFGSGPGFLCALVDRRWATLRCGKAYAPFIRGIEPSGVARKHAESLRLKFADFHETYNGQSLFRHAIATEVLEHVDDPLAALKQWRGALLPDGYLALSVPNDNNPLQRLFGRLLAPRKNESGGLIQCADRKRPWKHPTHLHYFNPKSLKALVESAGFEVVWQRTSFPVELLLVLPIPRKLAWKLSRLWPAPPLLWRFAIGRHCLLVARKVP